MVGRRGLSGSHVATLTLDRHRRCRMTCACVAVGRVIILLLVMEDDRVTETGSMLPTARVSSLSLSNN